MKAFWTIRPAVQNAAGMWEPDLPALESLGVNVPGDINRMAAGAAPADHVHILAGGVALASEQAGGGHEHYLVFHNGSWVQQVRGTAAAHSHRVNAAPDFYLCFITCSAADFAALIAAGVRVICEADTAAGGPGALLDAPWTTNEQNYWTAAALNNLGIGLPAVVNRGSRLVSLLLGLFLSRRPMDDRAYRQGVSDAQEKE